jgi:hypothetical protein
MQEWSEKCDWCGAMPGEPCKDHNGNVLHHLIHRPRAIAYDKQHGLDPMPRLKATFTWPQVQKIEGNEK